MTLTTAWQTPSQVRSVRTTAGGSVIPTTWTYDVIEFDTGDGGMLACPPDDWVVLTTAVGAIEDDSGKWWFPCESTITLMMHGSQSREYVVPLAFPDQPYSADPSYCLTTTNNEGGSDVW